MRSRSAKDHSPRSFGWRAYALQGLLACAALGLLWRAVDLQLVDHGFLAKEGAARFSRVTKISAHRGTITDRYGEPLAVSTPVDSIWANPKELALAIDQIPRLAQALKVDQQELARRITSNLDREFLYLARHRQPAEAQKIKALGIPGVYLMREYRRYYPAGEVTGHVLGFTNIDDAGQEGIELAFDHWLAGEDGAKRVIQDRFGRVVQDVESIRPARPGRDLVLSLDLRIQYLAYRELKAAIRQHRARAGSVVVLDVTTGEVLAMVNQPAYNPNDREQISARTYRNRAATDIFEPGSSIKPFVVAAGLASGKYDAGSIIDTSGVIRIGRWQTEDEHDIGRADLTTILAKSSNVGMARLALSLEPQQLWETLTRLGFGRVTTSGYPGESAGLLSNYTHWRPIGIASLSRGYGLSVTPLQLAVAYAAMVGDGKVRSPRVGWAIVAPGGKIIKEITPPVIGEVPVAKHVRDYIRNALSQVPQDGTAAGAFAGFPFDKLNVGGKTGTAEVYGKDDTSWFASFAPAKNPRFVVVVMVSQGGMGAETAAPAVRRIYEGIYGLGGKPAALPGGRPPERPPVIAPDGTVAQ